MIFYSVLLSALLQLVKLPNDPCVNDILQEFLATESSFPDAVHLFVDGLKVKEKKNLSRTHSTSDELCLLLSKDTYKSC